MTQISDELLCGDDVNVIYGDDWYFNMAEQYLSGCKSSESKLFQKEINTRSSLPTTTLKDAA